MEKLGPLLDPSEPDAVITAVIGARAAIDAAVIAADATIKAAQMAAEATRFGAWIQSGATVLAGALAIGAGWLAYRGALRQVRLNEDQHRARTDAYRMKIFNVASELEEMVALAELDVMRQEGRLATLGEDEDETLYRGTDEWEGWEEFSLSNWADHALLGARAVHQIHSVRQRLNELITADRVYVGESAKDNIADYLQAIRNLRNSVLGLMQLCSRGGPQSQA
jgi:hypothetical protein